MYFQDNKENTNIDKDFNNNQQKKLNFNINKKTIIVISVIVGIIILAIIFTRFTGNQTYLVLEGPTDLILYQDSEYIEYGYRAYNKHNKDLTNQVIVDNQINTSIAGEYTITYTIKDLTKSRTVTIVSKTEQKIYLILKGLPTIYLKVGETYTEPGYDVLDTESFNSKDRVTITGKVDTTKAGTYKLVYSIMQNNGVSITAERTIIVTDTNIFLNSSPTTLTNKTVTININVSDNYFDYLILPNGKKEYKRTTTYTVSNNGTYKFIVYSKDGSHKEKTIDITNIDTTPPKITSCTGTINDNVTTYTVKTNDKDIQKYVYNNQYTTKETTYKINANVPNASLTAYDQAGNSATFTCKTTVVINYEKPIMPSGGENIIKQAESDTLKFWIEKITRPNRPYYHVAHIWAKDPYNQLKSGVPNNFGNQLLRPSDILTQKINSLGLQNKLIIAINGSGFVKNGVFDSEMYRINPGYDKTSVSPVVISEGKLLRDYTNIKVKTAYTTYGLKKNGFLEAYSYGDNIQQNMETAKKIINDGVKNTWAFYPILLYNGEIKTEVNQRNIRNAVCQINKNNFVLITDVYKTGRQGFTFVELAEYMKSIGCKNGYNLDGGGSVAMIYKDKNTSTPTVLSGNGREIADILYFHE